MEGNFVKKLILTIIASAVLYVSTSCNLEKKEYIPKTYAILYCSLWDPPEDNLIHPIDKNMGWNNIVSAFNLLDGMGVDDMFLLYYDGIPKLDEQAVSTSKVEREFEGEYSNVASLDNLMEVEQIIQGRLNPEDRLILYMHASTYSTYVVLSESETQAKIAGFLPTSQTDKWNGFLDQIGSYETLEKRINGRLIMQPKSLSSVYLLSEFDNRIIHPSFISDLLNNNVSTDNLVILESHYAGNFLSQVEAPGTFIGASNDNPIWYDRYFSFARLYLGALADPNSDADGDAQVSYKEAFDKAIIPYQQIGAQKEQFIWDEYIPAVIEKITDPMRRFLIINSLVSIEFNPSYIEK